MKLSKVKLRNIKNGVILKVNEDEWARDLGRGKFRGYERVGEINSGRVEDVVDAHIKSAGLEEEAKAAITDEQPQVPDLGEAGADNAGEGEGEGETGDTDSAPQKEEDAKPTRATSRRGRHNSN